MHHRYYARFAEMQANLTSPLINVGATEVATIEPSLDMVASIPMRMWKCLYLFSSLCRRSKRIDVDHTFHGINNGGNGSSSGDGDDSYDRGDGNGNCNRMRITSNLNMRAASPFSASLSEEVFLESVCGTHLDSPTLKLREIQNLERLRGQSPEARGRRAVWINGTAKWIYERRTSISAPPSETRQGKRSRAINIDFREMKIYATSKRKDLL
jgi:hypothetical protein